MVRWRTEMERETGIEPGDIQLGKLAFYVRKAMPHCVFSACFNVIAYVTADCSLRPLAYVAQFVPCYFDFYNEVDSMDSKVFWRDCWPRLERETGIEPATNGLGSRDSTTELLPLATSILPGTCSDCQ